MRIAASCNDLVPGTSSGGLPTARSGEDTCNDPYRRRLAEDYDKVSPMETNNHEGGSPGRASQILLQMMSQMSEQMQALRAEREADREETRADREETRVHIRALQSAIATPTQTPQPAPQPDIIRPELRRSHSPENIITKRKPTLPDPPKFDGTRRKFRPWYLEMRAKLTLDSGVFTNDQERFAYVYARLEGTAQNMAAAYFEQGAISNTQSASQFLDYLNRRYGDPNAKARAQDRLRSLRQRPDESFATFLPKFEKELADSGGGSWNDEVQINYLDGALNSQFRDKLISVTGIPTDFNSYTELLLTISSRMDSQRHQDRYPNPTREKYKREPYHYKPDQEHYHKHADSDNMDWEPTKVSKSTSQRNNGQSHQRRSAPECYACGRLGHIARYCKNPNRDRREPKPETRVARSKPREESEKKVYVDRQCDPDSPQESNSDESGNE